MSSDSRRDGTEENVPLIPRSNEARELAGQLLDHYNALRPDIVGYASRYYRASGTLIAALTSLRVGAQAISEFQPVKLGEGVASAGGLREALVQGFGDVEAISALCWLLSIAWAGAMCLAMTYIHEIAQYLAYLERRINSLWGIAFFTYESRFLNDLSGRTGRFGLFSSSRRFRAIGVSAGLFPLFLVLLVSVSPAWRFIERFSEQSSVILAIGSVIGVIGIALLGSCVWAWWRIPRSLGRRAAAVESDILQGQEDRAHHGSSLQSFRPLRRFCLYLAYSLRWFNARMSKKRTRARRDHG